MNIYRGKKIFVTGHTGFKGGWLALWLVKLGATVHGYALPPRSKHSLFTALKLDQQIHSTIGNVLDTARLEETIQEFKPEMVFHLAAQPLVRLSYSDPVSTYQTNVIGTLNLLEASRKCESVRAFVNVTTDKCYENKEKNYAYTEDDRLGGYDMYSSSKACSEILTASYRNSFLTASSKNEGNKFHLATARAGNVIGGGDWATDRLIPDCIRALIAEEPLKIRNPKAIRPWQHVLEPLGGYLLLGKKLLENGEEFSQSFNFAPESSNTTEVQDIVKLVIRDWGSGEHTVISDNTVHEATLLQLNNMKAKKLLSWRPNFSVDTMIRMTIEWYKEYYRKNNMLDYTLSQINYFENSQTASITGIR